MEFRRAKLFRRTGRASFAVQMLGAPGVIEIHCTEVDWGDGGMVTEGRVDSLGTESSYKQCGRFNHVAHFEGLEVKLGHYDPNFKAFVQCKMRVVQVDERDIPAMQPAAGYSAERETSTSASCESVPPRRAFRWLSWIRK